MIPFNLDVKESATAVAALGTAIGALAQLRMAWRKEVSERARGVPATKKSRRGPILAVFLLLIAAMAGGFLLSQFLIRQSDRDSAALRSDLQTQIARISATAERLERVRVSDQIPTARAPDDHRGTEEVVVTITVGPCHGGAAATGEGVAGVCSEQEALRVTLCASVPSSARVTATDLYARAENSPQPWPESRAAPGQDLGRARFADKAFERDESAQTKQVCTGFAAWDGEQAHSARLVVSYAASAAAPEALNAAAAPIAAAGDQPVR